jgi:chromosome segregation ATPase
MERYYNENPQTEYLTAKIEEQEKAIRHWIGKCTELQKQLDESTLAMNELKEDMEYYNMLPWYERMFFKFTI